MKLKNGKEHFVLVDEKCLVEAWQKVNLKKAALVFYEDGDGNEVKRIRISAITKNSLFHRLISFLFRK